MSISPEIAPDGIATVAALRSAGVSHSMITRRCRAGGPWRRLLPGVVMLTNGEPTRRQQLRAAIAFAGPDAVITGADAFQAYGLQLRHPPVVHVLVPATRRLTTREFISVERTTRLPKPIVRDGLPFAPPARAALDIARRTSNIALLRSALALPVVHGLCDHESLLRELNEGNQRGTAAVRLALRQLDETATNVLHRHAAAILRDSPLPPPRWNVTIYDRKQRAMGYADAWWDEVGLAWQFGPPTPDSPAPVHGHLALTQAKVEIVRTSAAEVRAAIEDPALREMIVRELVAAFADASTRQRPLVEARCLSVPNTA
ncbi:type IV toxin-antitoxin system AbiEi family antitoxin [Thermocrispum municipale]|uniref:type IV toxin-antitoxin system AbiEi family antitoxin n=1 Tax=Thermocrispum municipale TaxID=37926 RepID=UPI0005B7C01C|nr:type IV toxin-antitoxin system AbiEi family antitoxin [Thermocrispum municipale]